MMQLWNGLRRSARGLAWWRDQQDGISEGAPIHAPPSNTPISSRAFDLIVQLEVTSQALYEARYRHPTWPRGASGVTIGVGYDVGYSTVAELHDDWDNAIPAEMDDALEVAADVPGVPAQALASQLHDTVDVAWSPAIAVHRQKIIPRWVGVVERNLLNTASIGPDCLGALVSLTYNRGASFDKPGDRYTEMRAIKQFMAAQAVREDSLTRSGSRSVLA